MGQRQHEAISGVTKVPSNVLQEQFMKELKRLQQHQILAPQGLDEIAEWHNSFVIVPKLNCRIHWCLDPTWLNQALIRPACKGPKLNDILPKLTNTFYISIINASPGYHNLNHDKKIFVLNNICISVWQVQIHWTTIWGGINRWYVPVKGWWNLQRSTKCVWYNRWDSNCRVCLILKQVMLIYHQENLKLNKINSISGVLRYYYLGKCYPENDCIQTQRSCACQQKCPHNKKKNYDYLSIINYQWKFSPSTAEVVNHWESWHHQCVNEHGIADIKT